MDWNTVLGKEGEFSYPLHQADRDMFLFIFNGVYYTVVGKYSFLWGKQPVGELRMAAGLFSEEYLNSVEFSEPRTVRVGKSKPENKSEVNLISFFEGDKIIASIGQLPMECVYHIYHIN